MLERATGTGRSMGMGLGMGRGMRINQLVTRRYISFLRNRFTRSDYHPGGYSYGEHENPVYNGNSAAYRVQPIIFKKPSFGERLFGAFQTLTLYVVPIYFILKFTNAWAPLFDDDNEEDSAENAGSKLGSLRNSRGESHHFGIYGRADIEGASEAGEEDDDDILFIPLGYPKIIPGEFYAGTDPEWSAFAEIAQDTKALSDTKESLVKLVSNAASSSPTLASNLGDPVQLMSYWIMHEFPYRAPPEYVRSGIEIGPDYIGWVSRVVSKEEAEKIKSMYSIEGIKESFWEAWKLVSSHGLNKVRTALGYQRLLHLHPDKAIATSIPTRTVANPNIESTLFDSDIPPYQEPQSAASSHPPSQQSPSQLRPQSQLPSFLRNQSYRDFSRPSPGTTSDPSSISSTFPTRRLLDAADPDFNISEATAAYRRMASKAKSKFVIPPRGVFRLHGLVGLRGSKGQASIYASGYYQPQERKWYNLSIELVSLIPVEQRPKGISRSS
ncbi:hypothetical protein KEM54_006313 [Ascosphaera aggregata]|nr:hypothetical protein KEM54_006313 [Ascosphaera aggregata]